MSASRASGLQARSTGHSLGEGIFSGAWRGDVLFGRTFCFHPRETRAANLSHAERIRGSGGTRLDVVDYCANLRIRCERYRHVSPVRVYEAGARGLRRPDGDELGSNG